MASNRTSSGLVAAGLYTTVSGFVPNKAPTYSKMAPSISMVEVTEHVGRYSNHHLLTFSISCVCFWLDRLPIFFLDIYFNFFSNLWSNLHHTTKVVLQGNSSHIKVFSLDFHLKLKLVSRNFSKSLGAQSFQTSLQSQIMSTHLFSD